MLSLFSVSDLLPPMAEYSYQWIFFFSIVVIALIYILYRVYSSFDETSHLLASDSPPDAQDQPKVTSLTTGGTPPRSGEPTTPPPKEEEVKAANDIESSVLTSVDEIENGLLPLPSEPVVGPEEPLDAEPSDLDDTDVNLSPPVVGSASEPSTSPERPDDLVESDAVEHIEEPPKEEGVPKKRKPRSKKIPV